MVILLKKVVALENDLALPVEEPYYACHAPDLLFLEKQEEVQQEQFLALLVKVGEHMKKHVEVLRVEVEQEKT